MKYCDSCGHPVEDSDGFCRNCGASLLGEQEPEAAAIEVPVTGNAAGTETILQKLDRTRHSIICVVNRYFESDGVKRIKWRDLFSAINKRHTREEAEDLFISGTYRTTPRLEEISPDMSKPWLYSRILFCMVLAYALMLVCVTTLDNNISLAGLIFLGSFAMPFAVLMLFFELNSFRNISFYTVLQLFFVGGAGSLVITLIIFSVDILEAGRSNFWSALMTGAGEELGKGLIVFYFLHRMRDCNYILQGMLVGAVIGAGFAALESAGYAMHALTMAAGGTRDAAIEAVTSSIYTRGFLSPGSHVAWAAITGGAFMLAKGSGPLSFVAWQSPKFWKIFIIPVVLHAFWNAPILDKPGAEDSIKYSLLVILVWIVLLILINMGLSQAIKVRDEAIKAASEATQEGDNEKNPEENLRG